jgi:hypothetical protein
MPEKRVFCCKRKTVIVAGVSLVMVLATFIALWFGLNLERKFIAPNNIDESRGNPNDFSHKCQNDADCQNFTTPTLYYMCVADDSVKGATGLCLPLRVCWTSTDCATNQTCIMETEQHVGFCKDITPTPIIPPDELANSTGGGDLGDGLQFQAALSSSGDVPDHHDHSGGSQCGVTRRTNRFNRRGQQHSHLHSAAGGCTITKCDDPVFRNMYMRNDTLELTLMFHLVADTAGQLPISVENMSGQLKTMNTLFATVGIKVGKLLCVTRCPTLPLFCSLGQGFYRTYTSDVLAGAIVGYADMCAVGDQMLR